MTTALELTEKELAELKALTKESDPAAALRSALAEYVRYAKRLRLKELSNQLEMQDNWRDLEQRELDAQHGQSGAD